MKEIATFKEFIEMKETLYEEAKETVSILAEAHPTIRNNAIVQKILRNKNAPISRSELSKINIAIFLRSKQLTQQMLSADETQRFLILAEQNLLNTVASTIAIAIASRVV